MFGLNLKTLKKAELIEECIRRRRDTEWWMAEHAKVADEYAAFKRARTEVAGDIECRVADLEAEIADLNRQLERKHAECVSLTSENGDLMKQIDTLEERIDELESEADERTDARDERIEQVCKAASKLLPGFESPDESIDVYDFRRSLDDLRDSVRG